MQINNRTIAYAEDTTSLGTTATDIDGLEVDVEAERTYRFKAVIYLADSGVTTASGFGLTGPSSTDIDINQVLLSESPSGRATHEKAGSFGTINAGSTAAACCALLEGRFTTTAAGTVGVAGLRQGGSNLVVQPGSYIEVEKI